ncbi:hypothetical protein [Streptomyces kutzneri]|uniref:hypothetical protein n=1 Tax=Streptomyces kutzneri TaxID=3051179 RepID=UPI003F99EE4C
MDAWWPLLIEAEFKPGLGAPLYDALRASLTVDEAPNAVHGPTGSHAGSAFQYGWWSYADEDLRMVLGQPVADPPSRVHCGGGSLPACRDAVAATLKQAAAATPAAVYPADGTCAAGNQWCADSIVQRPVGGLAHPQIN